MGENSDEMLMEQETAFAEKERMGSLMTEQKKGGVLKRRWTVTGGWRGRRSALNDVEPNAYDV